MVFFNYGETICDTDKIGTEGRVAIDYTVNIIIEHCKLGCHVTKTATAKRKEQCEKTVGLHVINKTSILVNNDNHATVWFCMVA